MYKPAVNLYVRPQHRQKIRHIGGMLRGLLHSYEGCRAIAGLTNQKLSTGRRVRLGFSSVRKALSFKQVAEATLGSEIKVRRILKH